MFHIKQRTAQPHSWHIGRHQKTPKSIHASGTSGRRHHVVTEPRLAFRHKTSGLSASRDDGAVFLTAANTNKRSVRRGFLLTLRGFLLRTLDVILFQHRVRRDGQTVGKSACRERSPDTITIRPRENGHTRADAATRPHPRTPEDDHDRFMLGLLKSLPFQLFILSKLFRH